MKTADLNEKLNCKNIFSKTSENATKVLVNEFSLVNTMWFAVGSLMQQGSDIVPK